MTMTEVKLSAVLLFAFLLALLALSFQPGEVVLATTGGPCPG